MERLTQAWQKLWFTPVSPASICLFRICYGLLAFVTGLLWLPDASAWFGNSGVVTIEALKAWQPEPRLDLIEWLNPGSAGVVALLTIYLIASAFMTIGFFTRSSTIVVWLLMLSFEHRNPLILTSGDKLLRIIGFLMIFAPAGKMFSVDSWLKRIFHKGAESLLAAPWAQRLIQLQVALLYWHAFWNKLSSPLWCNGTAVYYSVFNAGHSRLPVPYLLDHTWTIKLLTWGIMTIEFSLCSLIWFPICRYWVLLFGVLLHLGIDWTMYFKMFSWTMIACYITFIDPIDLKLVFHRGKQWLHNVPAMNAVSVWCRYKGPVVSSLIGIYVYAALAASLPRMHSVSALYNQFFLKLLTPTILFLGLEQDFDAYSYPPQIALPNIRPIILFSDSRSQYGERLSVQKSFFWHQIVCHLFDPQQGYSEKGFLLWRDLAHFIARQNETPLKHPTIIILEQCWLDLHEPKPSLPVSLGDTCVKNRFVCRIEPGAFTKAF